MLPLHLLKNQCRVLVDVVGFGLMLATYQHQVADMTTLLVRLIWVETLAAIFGGFDMADLGDKRALSIDDFVREARKCASVSALSKQLPDRLFRR